MNKIDLWELQKANGGQGISNYLAFRYDDTNAMTGDTLKLAKKIAKGIESYSIYTPVATCRRTQTSPFTDGISDIGKYTTNLQSPADQLPINLGQLAQFASMRPFWLKTTDEITPNSDGTLSRTEQWTGYDDIDTDLYQSYTQT